jgi:hypothetical protein
MARAVSTPRTNLFQFMRVSTPFFPEFENGGDGTWFSKSTRAERKHLTDYSPQPQPTRYDKTPRSFANLVAPEHGLRPLRLSSVPRKFSRLPAAACA